MRQTIMEASTSPSFERVVRVTSPEVRERRLGDVKTPFPTRDKTTFWLPPWAREVSMVLMLVSVIRTLAAAGSEQHV